MQPLPKTFAIKIDGNIEVNFDGFEAVIDAVGGVDMELTPLAEAGVFEQQSIPPGTCRSA